MSDKEKWYHKRSYSWNKRDKPVVSYRKLTAMTFLIFTIICMLGSQAVDMQWWSNKSIPVKQEYMSYLNAAPVMYDPIQIVQTLERALQGIENLGLKPTDSGAAFSWDVNYHHTVQFNIDQINSVIDLGNNVIEWKEMSYQGTVVENVNDVYYEKVLNLRRKADDVDTTNIANAYCFNNKPELFWYVYTGYIFLISLFATGASAFLLMFAWFDHE